ncbi:hypothetical protein [Paenibacillus oralis]|uniref:hypothetical protein n=1 Tax=Paenibacillus oralis TaxID=2490856 RepID=UPI001FE6BC54|nr:hypothetical protein [Paenibacillus oralis]
MRSQNEPSSVLAALSGNALGWMGRARTMRKEAGDAAESEAVQRAEVEYIKRGVGDMKVEQKLQEAVRGVLRASDAR